MEDDDKTTITPKPEETTPAPEATPPTVTSPEKADDDVRGLISQLSEKVESLTEIVNSIASANPEQDSTPVSKPWTHWGGK